MATRQFHFLFWLLPDDLRLGRKLRDPAGVEVSPASVAPSLGAKDVDALYLARPSTPLLEVLVTDEALETYVIRSAHRLAALELRV